VGAKSRYRREDQDQGQEGGEVPHCQGLQGFHPAADRRQEKTVAPPMLI